MIPRKNLELDEEVKESEWRGEKVLSDKASVLWGLLCLMLYLEKPLVISGIFSWVLGTLSVLECEKSVHLVLIFRLFLSILFFSNIYPCEEQSGASLDFY